MDGFLNAEQYDVFDCQRPPIHGDSWPEADQNTIARAIEFFENDTHRSPKLAVVYLYSTHAPYHCETIDEKNQPCAEDGYIIPYPETMRDAVWNRYQNSARTVDRLLEPLLSKDRVIVVTGDHGEAFLEDGTCGHGTKLSHVQNRTPLIIHGEDIKSKVIEHPTMHADLLPTLIALCDIPYENYDFFDGINIVDRNQKQLDQREFLTRDYLSNDAWWIGSWASQGETIGQAMCRVSLEANEFQVIGKETN